MELDLLPPGPGTLQGSRAAPTALQCFGKGLRGSGCSLGTARDQEQPQLTGNSLPATRREQFLPNIPPIPALWQFEANPSCPGTASSCKWSFCVVEAGMSISLCVQKKGKALRGKLFLNRKRKSLKMFSFYPLFLMTPFYILAYCHYNVLSQ